MFKIYLDSASSLLRIINLGLGWWFSNCPCKSFSSVQLLSHVKPFVSPWTAACLIKFLKSLSKMS